MQFANSLKAFVPSFFNLLVKLTTW